jgi:hypothetical protein
MTHKPPARLYVNIEDLKELLMDNPNNEEDEQPEFELDGAILPELAYNLGASAVDFYLGALSRFGGSNAYICIEITGTFVRALLDNQLAHAPITVTYSDDSEDDEPEGSQEP